MESAGGENLSGVDDILSDTSRSYRSRLQAASLTELKLLFNLAAPAALAYLTTFTMAFSTLKLCGHLVDKAAYNWVVNFFQIVTYTCMLGMSRAVETACGQAHGAQKYDVLVTQLQKSIILLTAAGLPFAAIYIVSSPIMSFLEDEFSPRSSRFVYGLIPQIFAYAVYFPVQKFLQAQNIVAPSAYISAAALVLHLILNWVLIVKLHFGLLGASLTLSFSWWLLAIVQFVYILRCKYTWRQLSDFADFGRLGGGLLARSVLDSMATEFFNFVFSVIPFVVAGTFVNGEGTSAVLGIWVYVIWLGLSSALSTRVSNGLGAGRPEAVQFSVAIAALASFTASLLLAALVVLFSSHRNNIFIEGSDAPRVLVELRPFLTFIIVLSSVHPILTGVAVGCGWQLYVTGIDIGCFYLIGMTLGCLLEFYFQYETGLLLGIVVSGLVRNVILSWMVHRADWIQEVNRVRIGVAPWEGQK
uniref:Protein DETOXIFICATION n=1 Tax=Kalanchoe fedtschenkoi TaxID=63787 RepID=A0A7N0SWQ9_KALFE